MLLLNGVVENETSGGREKFNLSLPPELMEELNRIAARFGSKRKWLVFAAAALRLIEAGEEAQNLYVRQVSDADLNRTLGDLLREAKDTGKRGGVKKIVVSGSFPPKNQNHRRAQRQ